MAVVGELAQIVRAKLDLTFGQGPAQDSVFQESGEKTGKYRDDLEAHTHSMIRLAIRA
jgi:hypothetical protein